MKKRIILATINQGLLSLFNFLLNLYLIKSFSDDTYGVFTVLFALSLLLIGVQNALINTPYSINQAEQEQARFSFCGINLVYCLLFPSIIALAVSLYSAFNQIMLSGLAVFVYLCANLFKEYFRSKWIVDCHVKKALFSDVFFVGLIALCYAAIMVMDIEVNLNQVLIVVAAAGLFSIGASLFAEVTAVKLITQTHLRGYAKIWQQSKWSLVGVLTTEIQNRGYVYVLGAYWGASTLGLIQAGRIFFGPLNLIVAGWTRVVRPVLAQWFGQKEKSRFTQLLKSSFLSFAAINLAFALFIFYFWDWIDAALYAGKYDNMLLIVMLWAGVNLILQVRGVFSTALQATNSFKPLAKASMAGIIAVALTMPLVIFLQLPILAIAAIIVSELIVLVFIGKFLSEKIIQMDGDNH